MDREYLEDYEQRERTEYEAVGRRIREGRFSFEKDKHPSEDRFWNLQKPTAVAITQASKFSDVWSQIPFSGSLVVLLYPISQEAFERIIGDISEISNIVDFIKETGRLQVAFPTLNLRSYEGLEYLNPFFEELRPPAIVRPGVSFFESEKNVKTAADRFYTIGGIRFLDWEKRLWQSLRTRGLLLGPFSDMVDYMLGVYQYLKLGGYAITESMENLMVDDPLSAGSLLNICGLMIYEPTFDLCCTLTNYTLEFIRESTILPLVYRAQEIRLPCEIGKFLLKKLTYAAQDMRACYELMDNYDANDLRKVQESLNEAIVTGHPDIVTQNTEELSQILDNVWSDRTVANRIKNIEIGVPVSIAAVGGIAGALVAGPVGAGLGGFLSELGFKIAEKATEKYAEKLFSVKGEGLTERLAKLRTKSYQANIYDFKKKYNK